MEIIKRELYREIETLLNHYYIFKNKDNQNSQALLNYESFTNREKEVVGLIAHGLSTQQVADDLFISEKEEIGATTGTKRKFSIMQIKECEKEILFMTKLLEQNGNVVNSNWVW